VFKATVNNHNSKCASCTNLQIPAKNGIKQKSKNLNQTFLNTQVPEGKANLKYRMENPGKILPLLQSNYLEFNQSSVKKLTWN